MALDIILGDRTYPEFWPKRGPKSPQNRKSAFYGLIWSQTRQFDLTQDKTRLEQPQAGLKSMGLVFWDILTSKKSRGNIGHPDSG